MSLGCKEHNWTAFIRDGEPHLYCVVCYLTRDASSNPLPTASLCDCGGTKARTTHSAWCHAQGVNRKAW